MVLKIFAKTSENTTDFTSYKLRFLSFLLRSRIPKTFLDKRKLIFILLLISLMLAGISRVANKRNMPSKLSPLVVKTFALGRVQPTGYIRSIAYPMMYQASRIKNLYVEENDFVRKGTPLFTVEDSNEAFYNMESSKAQLRQQISLQGRSARIYF